MIHKIDNLTEILDRINQIFREDFSHMDFFFCFKNDNVRTTFNVIRSLPNLLLVESDYKNSITFESTWSNVNCRSQNYKNLKNYFAHSFMEIKSVKQVNIHKVGFDIISEGGIDLFGICSDAHHDRSITYLQRLVGQPVWSLGDITQYWSNEKPRFNNQRELILDDAI